MENREDINQYAKVTISDLIAHWSIQESLLQTYRNQLYVVETFFLTIALFFYTKQPENEAYYSLLIFPFFGLFILRYYLKILSKRGQIVFFWQTLILKAEKNEFIDAPFNKMKKTINTGDLIDKEYDFLKEAEGNTRVIQRRILLLTIFTAWAGYILALLNSWEVSISTVMQWVTEISDWVISLKK